MKKTINVIILLSLVLILTNCNRARTKIQPNSVYTKNHISQLAQSVTITKEKNGKIIKTTTKSTNDIVNSNGRFITKLQAASSFLASKNEIREYLDTGMTVVDLYCLNFFKQISTSQAHRQYLRSETNQVGGFVSAILGITDAGSNVTGGFGALFSLFDATVENYDAAFLVAPDLPTVQDLINRTQRLLANELMKQDNKYTYPEAERALVMYANNCTFNGIRSIVNKSLATTKPSPNNDTKSDSTETKTKPSPDTITNSNPANQSTGKVLGMKFNNY